MRKNMPQGAPTEAEKQVQELKVSAYTMTMEAGLYCVFNAPESSMPDEASGLPCVRLAPAPGQAGAGAEVLGTGGGGWLGAGAAQLVRVGPGGAKVLVTVYQERETGVSAPQIQVIRIAGAAAEAATASTAATAQAAPELMELMAHVYGRGDVGNHVGEWTGEPGSKRWIEGFGIAQLGDVPSTGIEYQAVLGRGWLSPWSEGGQFCGSRGMSLPILGLRVRLRGRAAETHRLALSATFVDGSEVGPVGSGEPCEAASLAALEAFRVETMPIGTAGATGRPAPGKAKAKAAKAEAPVAPKAAAKRPAKPAPTPAPAPPPEPKGRGKRPAAPPAKPAPRRR